MIFLQKNMHTHTSLRVVSNPPNNQQMNSYFITFIIFLYVMQRTICFRLIIKYNKHFVYFVIICHHLLVSVYNLRFHRDHVQVHIYLNAHHRIITSTVFASTTTKNVENKVKMN